jgi:hypothetical protein
MYGFSCLLGQHLQILLFTALSLKGVFDIISSLPQFCYGHVVTFAIYRPSVFLQWCEIGP